MPRATKITLLVMAAVFGLIAALAGAFAAFVINPGEAYCVPVDPARPLEECTLTAAFFIAVMVSFLAGAVFGSGIGGAVLGLIAALRRVIGGKR